MLENVSPRLGERGGPHHGSPDKAPAARLETLRLAGELRIPFTTGILIGIGETRDERIEALLAIRDLHERYGHIQEVIIQNFRAKPGTRMARRAARVPRGAAVDHRGRAPDSRRRHEHPGAAESQCGRQQLAPRRRHQRLGRRVAGDARSRQSRSAVACLDALRRMTADKGKILAERLPSYPEYVQDAALWHDPAIATAVVRASDSSGYARMDHWSPGLAVETPVIARRSAIESTSQALRDLVSQARAGEPLTEAGIVRLFAARDDEFHFVCDEADALRREIAGETVRYVVNRNINYTNICAVQGAPSARFSKGRNARSLRGDPYDLPIEEIERRVSEAWARGATEVCMQGGIHPEIRRPHLSEDTRRSEARRARHTRARLHAARSDARCVHARHPGARFPERIDGCRTGHAAWYRCRNPR